MATAVRTSLLSNFSACWGRYMDTGKSSEFLKATVRLFPSSSEYHKDHIEIAKEVISGYSKSEPVTPTAGQASTIDQNKAAKVALGCLKAVRALLRDKTPRTNVHILLAACSEVGRSVQNFGSVSNEAMIREEVERILAMRKVDDDGREGALEEGVAQDRARLVAPLVMSTLRTFPAIHSIAVGRQHVEGYLAALMEANAWPAAVGLVKLYPQSVSVSRARALMDVLVRAEEAEVCGELASFLHQVYLQQQRQSRGRANTPGSAGDEEQRSVRDITHDELLSLVWALISSCLEADLAKSLKVALDVAEKLQLREVAVQIRARQMKQKMDVNVKKGKWQLSFQVVSKRTMEHKLCLYNCMIEHGLFIEAKGVYQQLKLHGLATAVTEEQVAAQRREIDEKYLSLPLPLKQVVVVDNLQSLEFAAGMLGVSLETDLPLVATEHTKPMSLGDLAQRVLQEDGSLRVADRLDTSQLMGPYRLAVGLDAEWRASMFHNLDDKGCSILQIATPNQVFLLDFRQICGELNTRHGSSDSPQMQRARRLLSNLMRDETVLKVGWAFLNEDVRMLRNNAKGYFRSAVESICSYVELNAGGAHIQRLEGAGAESVPTAEVPLSTAAEELVEGDSGKETQQIVEDSEGGVANENDLENGETDDAAAVEVKRKKVNTRSLAGACSMFLGKPLLKTEQMSDWDRRPLSEPQLRYASLDAHATLALMDAMLARMRLTDRAADGLLGIASLYPGALSAASSSSTEKVETSDAP